ncbi:DUF6452 family protein [Nonlabens marinus]|uniref:Lipoprotein n=1 Tax=Nonlabens marinus S1-08 TaxID=1454201 RepID=W8VRD8_9FLAO|nr:DUF6452 family protein [Nonlabens marinus]BAO55595.1 hypothetical protein NMS_1586 [Nonlabens marinus S1-08]
MNNSRLLLLGLIFTTVLASCEKDDLCVPEEAATPRLIVIFTDENNPLNRKPVASLQVIDQESQTAAPLNETGALTLTAVDSIAIPLRIIPGNTMYSFERTLNGTLNKDALNFNYTVDQEYINRACGFRAIYKDLEIDQPAETPSSPWIRNILIRNSNVLSNQDIHVEIRH